MPYHRNSANHGLSPFNFVKICALFIKPTAKIFDCRNADDITHVINGGFYIEYKINKKV